ncbi:MAG: tRNA (guanosine(37)-N1)-methyltransferase TrmD [Alphaproteobacteria bacterium]|jgi:tRNA (guanine37-N1)-methyltransferase|nr:tRNA (guanosine(37)-N1)-methyltransferase TrmD [Alphaproteobacteria bacterium]MBT5827738.1 tRNA (guanosine(37)-N1)-methyltransferase TrmD [Alphaproteobacteria bacterium]
MLKIKIITLHPDLFPGQLGSSILGEAHKKQIWNLEVFNLRDYSKVNKRVDDVPYGGGSGMVFRPDILANAIDNITEKKPENYKILYPTPRGKLLKQKKIVEFAKENNILLVCGRFEGIDQRIIEHYNIAEFSIGDIVISGGELAAQILIDAVVRTLPNVLGNSDSLTEESFAVNSEYENLLEYPHYTRPAIWQGYEVPQILRSGNHQKISEWRLNESKFTTEQKRPDLWQLYKDNEGNKNGCN